jgi:predicted GNAT superfamily acetyltransferase
VRVAFASIWFMGLMAFVVAPFAIVSVHAQDYRALVAAPNERGASASWLANRRALLAVDGNQVRCGVGAVSAALAMLTFEVLLNHQGEYLTWLIAAPTAHLS